MKLALIPFFYLGWLSLYAGRSEDAVTATVCDLIADPAAHDHKLIQITGRVLFGLGEFTPSSKACDKKHPAIWVEYGGTLKSGAIKDGWERRREQPLTAEGVSTRLVEDANFESFDTLVRKPLQKGRPANALRATFVGRYFAGKPGSMGVEEWRGYGMWGMYSLFVIPQVISTGS